MVADREGEEEQRQRIVAGEVARVEDVRLHVHAAAVALEMVVGQLPQLVEQHGGDGQRVEQRHPRPGIEPEHHEQRDGRRPQEAGNLRRQDGAAVGRREPAFVEPVEGEGRGLAERPLAQPRMQEGERCEQEPQEDEQRKHEHVERVARHARDAAPLEHVGNVLRILGRAVVALAVVVAVVPREERARRERHHAHREVPGRLKGRHLVPAEMADLVDQRAEPVEPEGGQREGHRLPPRPERRREVDRGGQVGGHHADEEVGPVAGRRYPEEIDVGVADRPPHLADPRRRGLAARLRRVV